MKSNSEIRQFLKERGLKQWEVAQIMGISEFTLCRKLRYRLSLKDQKKILDAIDKLEGVNK